MYLGALLAFLGHIVVCTASWHTCGAFLDITIIQSLIMTFVKLLDMHKIVLTCTLQLTLLIFFVNVCDQI